MQDSLRTFAGPQYVYSDFSEVNSFCTRYLLQAFTSVILLQVLYHSGHVLVSTLWYLILCFSQYCKKKKIAKLKTWE